MDIIEGDFQGRTGRIVKGVLAGPMFQISTGLMQSVEYKIPADIATIKLLSKDERRTFGQLVVLVLLALTIIGFPVAILAFFLWKRVTFTIGVRTRDGKKFIAQGDASDWKTVKGYVGLGSLDSF